jgi:hypothetical protein
MALRATPATSPFDSHSHRPNLLQTYPPLPQTCSPVETADIAEQRQKEKHGYKHVISRRFRLPNNLNISSALYHLNIRKN